MSSLVDLRQEDLSHIKDNVVRGYIVSLTDGVWFASRNGYDSIELSSLRVVSNWMNADISANMKADVKAEMKAKGLLK